MKNAVVLTGIFGCMILSIWCCSGCIEKTATEVRADDTGAHGCTLIASDTAYNIQLAIDLLPESGGTVQLRPGITLLSRGIHISRSNVTLAGVRGACLKLAPGVNEPVILIGSDQEAPQDPISNIHILNMRIDGSMGEQSSEIDPARPWLRNNGIDIRRANDLWIDHVEIFNARSGGIVASWGCNRIFIDKSSFHDNYFDGIALYDSRDIQVSNFLSFKNRAAGISLDNGLRRVLFSNGIVQKNASSGIFVREATDLSFFNLMIMGNGHADGPEGEDGCFLSHSDQPDGRKTGVERLFFNSCSFIENKRNGLYLASPLDQSPRNSVVACLFSGNGGEAIKLHPEGHVQQSANIFQ